MEDDKALTEIRKIAYRLWMEDGRPDGEDRRHWDRAKEIWAFEHAGDAPAAMETQRQPAATSSRRRGSRSLPAPGLGG
jgi:hypothetical protein